MKKYFIRNPNKMHRNLVNFLFGASVAMKAIGLTKLNAFFATSDVIRFETDCPEFVVAFGEHLAQYDLTIESE